MRLYSHFRFSDPNGTGGAATPPVTPPAATIPDDVRAELEQLRAERAASQAAAKRAAEEEALKKGEAEATLKKLQAERDEREAELKTLREKEAARAKKLDEMNKAAMERIPADRRTLVPAALQGEALSEYLETNKAFLFEDGKPAGTPAATGKRPAVTVPAACEAEWKRYGASTGVTLEEWFEGWKTRNKQEK